MNWRVPWWMQLITAVYVITFVFNARQEVWGPANVGWALAWPNSTVSAVTPGWAMDRAGLRAGDIVQAVNGRPLTGIPDWFVTRAHIERDRPIEFRMRRGQQELLLEVTVTEPSWRTWTAAHWVGVVVFYCVRFMLLLLAIVVGFSRPERLRARLAALMLAVGAVAEGYPSPGWAAALHHLPAVLAIAICLATVSCLLAPMIWLSFFATFRRSLISAWWQRFLVLAPGVLFGVPLVASVIAMIYAPSVLARPWPQLLSAIPVRLIQDVAGVCPLLFLNVLTWSPSIGQIVLLELWLAVSVVYLVGGFLVLAASLSLIGEPDERRRAGQLCLPIVIFGLVVVHNIFERNWSNWLGSPQPVFFSSTFSVAVNLLFLLVPLTLAHYALGDEVKIGDNGKRKIAGT